MFEQIVSHFKTTIEADELLGAFTTLLNTVDKYDARLKKALRDDGLAFVVAPLNGILDNPRNELLVIKHEVVVAVIENTAVNTSSMTALRSVERLLTILHNSSPSNGTRLKVYADTPAYEQASVDEGTAAYIVNFKFKTVS